MLAIKTSLKCTSLVCCIIFLSFCGNLKAQDLWQEQDPWEGVPEYYKNWDYPDFQFPNNLSTWEKDRLQVRATLMELLGDIPARPKNPKVQVLSKEERNGYTFEKFVIDNEVDSPIPGYLAIPTHVKGKVPVVLGLHGHGSSKDNILDRKSTRLNSSHVRISYAVF